jgi:hypothetical protein
LENPPGKYQVRPPIADLLITIAIFGIVYQSAWAVFTRIINSLAVAPANFLCLTTPLMRDPV